MNEAVNKKPPLPWWRRILLVMVLFAIAILAILILTAYLAERQLSNEIIKISRAGEPITFPDLQGGHNQSSTSEDATPYYVEALSSIQTSDLENLKKINIFYRKSIFSLPVNQFPSEIFKKTAQSLARFQSVLEKLDKAATLPLSRFDIGIEQGKKVCATRLKSVQTANFLLSLRTLHLILRGDDDTAADSVIAMLKMIRILDLCPTMLLHTAKTVFVVHACQDIHLFLDHTRPSEKSLVKLQNALSQAIPQDALERMFFAERAYQLEVARNLIPDNIASRFLQDKVTNLPERLSLPSSRWGRLHIRRKSVQYLRDMAQLITAARRPWPEPLDATVTNMPLPTEKKPGGLLSSGAVLIRLNAGALALVRCTILTVAIERYRHRYGELPATLDDLCPVYIDSLPIDPFTGKKLLFSRDEEAYVVYSLGANRRDDGGSVIRDADGKGPQDSGLRIRLRRPK